MEDQAFGWNSEISRDGQPRVTLEPGVYWFHIRQLDKTKWSTNLQAPMANVTIAIGEADGETQGVCYENFVLHPKAEWKLCEFFRGIGCRKHGESFRMDWGKVPNAYGRCEVDVEEREFNGTTRTRNVVKRFLDFEDDWKRPPIAQFPLMTPPVIEPEEEVAHAEGASDEDPF